MPSIAISRIEYEPGAATLDVWFRDSGRLYRYYHVPVRVFEAFRKSVSKGRFFNNHIRDRYDFAHITAEGPDRNAA